MGTSHLARQRGARRLSGTVTIATVLEAWRTVSASDASFPQIGTMGNHGGHERIVITISAICKEQYNMVYSTCHALIYSAVCWRGADSFCCL
jgi:hypothetical protein